MYYEKANAGDASSMERCLVKSYKKVTKITKVVDEMLTLI